MKTAIAHLTLPGGHAHMTFAPAPATLSLVQANRLRALEVTTSQRSRCTHQGRAARRRRESAQYRYDRRSLHACTFFCRTP